MECDPQAWANTVSSNVGGTFFPIRAIFPYLKGSQHQRAKVLVFSGGGSTKARPFFSAYGAAKTAIVRLAETLAEEWRQMPIDINAVAPGAIYTPMIEEIIQHGARIVGEAEYAAALKLKAQRDSASRVIDLVFFLLSADSDRLSGKLISAAWDPWIEFAGKGQSLSSTELYTLRRLIQ
jgi:NAD(P)-dependent dehydrogenase (short-subunit alcohol dehydrogenase family)